MSSGHSTSTQWRIRVVLCCAFTILSLHFTLAGDDAVLPLHAEINQLVATEVGYDNTARAGDAQFLRRVTLDLTGLIPRASAVLEFCADGRQNKRSAAIDRLLDSPEHIRHMQRVMDGWLMRRRPNRNVTADEWRDYLRHSISSNKHWDQLTVEILKSDGADPATRAAARFYLDRDCNTDDLVRDIGAIFLGRDIRCAQCHDHPIVPDFKQADYFGIAAFIDRSFLFDDKQKQQKIVAEKSEGVTAFTSALTQISGVTSPKIFDGPKFPDPILIAKQIADALEPEGLLPVPSYSRRAYLPVAVVNHPAFGRTLANRLWAMVFGRGIVEPIDQDHRDNPPVHPKLLELLSVRIGELRYDMRAFLRELTLTDLYARSASNLQLTAKGESHPAMFDFRKLTPEQLAWSWLQATGKCDVELASSCSESLTADALNPSRSDVPQSTPEEIAYDRLTADAEKVIKIFTTSLAGEPNRSDTTTEQALFLLNGDLLREWIAVRPGNLLERLMKTDGDDRMIFELFLSVLSRQPDPEEIGWVREVLAGPGTNREAAIADVIEALLISTEFRFNH